MYSINQITDLYEKEYLAHKPSDSIACTSITQSKKYPDLHQNRQNYWYFLFILGFRCLRSEQIIAKSNTLKAIAEAILFHPIHQAHISFSEEIVIKANVHLDQKHFTMRRQKAAQNCSTPTRKIWNLMDIARFNVKIQSEETKPDDTSTSGSASSAPPVPGSESNTNNPELPPENCV